jgi:Ca-activated chloride channel family protein
MNNSMNHPEHGEWKQLVSAYIDDELSSEEKDTLHNHLVDCPACQKYLKELQSLSLNIKSLNNQSLSPDLEQRLNQLRQPSTERSPMNKPTFSNVVKVTVPLLAVIMIVFSLQTYSQRAIQARIRDAATYMSMQTASLGNTNQYEAYYQSSDYDIVRDSTDAVPSSSSVIALKSQPAKGDITWKDTAVLSKDAFVDKNGLETVRRQRKEYSQGFAKLEEKQNNAKKVTWTDSATMDKNNQLGEIRSRSGVSSTVMKFGAVEGAKNVVVAGAVAGEMLYAPAVDSDGRMYQREIYNGPQYPYAPIQLQESNTEQYDLINENDFADVSENPLSTFSIDVDTASYSNIRRMLNNNQLPPRDAVRIEEMINYFKYNYPQPGWNQPFSITMEQGVCPWNPGHQIVLVGLQGKELTARETPLSNLVFLIDVSGSMDSPDKLPLLKESLKMMVAQLRPEERVSMVVYAGNAGLVLDSTPAYNKGLIMSAIDNLQAGGSTAGGQGIQLAYGIAAKNFINNGNNRVILATDGDFNVGVSSDSELVQIIEEKRKTGIFLTVLGFGTGNLQDAKMEKLADKGNGNYFYIDSTDEGKKVLVDELGSTMIAIAKDVKLQIEFNPKAVKAYRLIGYENRKLAKEDFNDDTKDAGELGAGHTVTALYEIVPAGSWENTSGNVDPLKYQKKNEKTNYASNTEMMTVKLRYKEPKSETSQLITKVLKTPSRTFGQTWYGSSDNLQFASAVAEFGMLLRNSQYTANSSYQAVVQRAQNSAYNDPNGHKNEFISLVQKAASLDNRQRPQVPVYQPQYPIYQQYDQQGGYQQK